MESSRERLGKEQLSKEARRFATVVFNLARVCLALLLLVLAERVAFGGLTTETAIAIAALAAAALLVLGLTPRLVSVLSQRVSKISVGPFAVEVFEAVEKAVPAEGIEDPEKREHLVTSVLALRLKIERKLTYLAKHVLDDDEGNATFLTVGSLNYDKLLPDEEADIVNRLMTLRDEDLKGMPQKEKDEFLKAADVLARSIRAAVLHCLVWKKLKELQAEDDGWQLRKIRRREGKRKDFLAEKNGYRFRIAPTFATDSQSELLDRVKKRLRPKQGREKAYAKRIVVLPHRSGSEREPRGEPAVVTTDDFVVWLDFWLTQAEELASSA